MRTAGGHRRGKNRQRQRPEQMEYASSRQQAIQNQPRRQTTGQSTDARALATQILLRVEQEGAFSDVLLDGVARRNDLTPTGKALTRQFVKGVLTNRSVIDKILAERLSAGIASLAPALLQVLRIGSYQLLYLDRAPKPLVVNESVALARTLAGEGAGRLTNAVLRRIVREQPSRTIDTATLSTADEIAEATNHPSWVVALWLEQLGRDETIKLCLANNERLPTVLRANVHRTTVAKLERELTKEGVDTRRSTLAPEAIIIEKLPRGITLGQLSSIAGGYAAVQDEGSILVSRLLAPQPGETIVDLCAAPGGKSMHLAALMMDKGRVFAIDPTERKLLAVRELAQRLGLRSIRTIESDGRVFKTHELVDAVLVDAPCSGLGMVARKADLRWKRDETSLEELCALQRELLTNAASLVKPGGRIVYSTCTINRQENESQVETFLEANPDFKIAAPPDGFPPHAVSGGYLKTLPHVHRTGGMFGVLLRRLR